MKNIFEKIEEIVDKYGVMQLLGSDSSCACGSCEIFGIKIDTHCYKSNGFYNGKDYCDCKYSGVHISKWQDIDLTEQELKAIANIFADYIRESYMTDVEIRVEK